MKDNPVDSECQAVPESGAEPLFVHDPQPVATLPEVLAGLRVQMAECVLHFDRPTALRPLATASVRGLAGHALTADNARLVRPFFKPGQDGHQPPAYLFQPVRHEPCTDDRLPFHLIAWDPDGQFLAAQLEALELARGRPFGENGSRVEGLEVVSRERLEFCGVSGPSQPTRLAFLTPVAVKWRKVWLDEREITLAHLCLAMVRRVNALSQYYGQGGQVDPTPWLAEASLCRPNASRLRWVNPCRRSSTQQADLSLSGLVGWMDFPSLSAPLQNLLSLAAVLHLGYHTNVGAGLLKLGTRPQDDSSKARRPNCAADGQP